MLALGALTGCSGKEDAPPDDRSLPVEALYNRAAATLDSGDFLRAEMMFIDVERQYPYSIWAKRAQLMAAYSAYKDLRYDEALLSLNRFIQLHPGSKDIAYAHYLRALCFYEQISDVRRDQDMTRHALEALDVVIRRFPDTEYARDARLKYDLTRDHLAGKEMEVGRYYLKRESINAAIGRFTTVIREFQTTTHVPEALHRLVESYLMLGLDDQAAHVAAVLGHNYPGSKWYERSYALLKPDQRAKIEDGRSWFRRTIESLLETDD